ncbi:MAG: cell division protein FtsA, partial [Dehalococcoidia bacterium]|nr:cell division protein FtsA [Dehalococcoidia bacterium]
LEVETHIVTAAVTSVQNLSKCVNNAGIEIDDIVFQGLASAETILSEEEREMGVLLADIGGGTTDLTLFVDGAVWHSASLPVGGWHLSNDIAIVLSIPFYQAEELKLRAATAMPSQAPAGDLVTIPATADTPAQQTPRRYLAEIVEARVEKIVEMILAQVKRAGYDGLLPAGIVLTGGAANLAGLDQFVREFTRLPVRVGRPRGLRGLTDTVSDAAYATSVGLLQWGLKHGDSEPRLAAQTSKGRRSSSGSLYERLRSWARDLMPQ